MSTSLKAHEKKAICRAFVIDVLTERVKSFRQLQINTMTTEVKKVLTKEVVDKMEGIRKALAETDKDLLSLFDIETYSDRSIETKPKMVKFLTYDPRFTWYLEHAGPVFDKDFGLSSKGVKIPLVVAVPEYVSYNEPEDFLLFASSKPSAAVKKLIATEDKLEEDAKRLFKKAMESLKNVRTLESLEKKVPELIPYTETSSKDVADLADLASCMRVKDTC